jgi:hypothetical protein
MKDQIQDIWDWILTDYRSHKLRFVVEVFCWLNSLVCSIIFNSTVPHVPFLIMYPLWISGTLAYAWCAYSRNSFGMLTTFAMLASMDMIGYVKVLLYP